MVEKIKVTREQVQAARLELQALQSAGLRPDPMVRKLAMAEGTFAKEAPPEQLQLGRDAISTLVEPKLSRTALDTARLEAARVTLAQTMLKAFPGPFIKELIQSPISSSFHRMTPADILAVHRAIDALAHKSTVDPPSDVEVDQDQESRRGA